jgi:6-phosphogluconolactonase
VRTIVAIWLVGCGGPSVKIDAASSDAADARPAGPTRVYVGAGDNTIRAFELVTAPALQLDPIGMVATGAGPSFLAFDRERRWLVAVNEGADALESFTIAADGSLARVNTQPASGTGPAHVALDGSGAWALVANYDNGSAAVLPVSATGMLGQAVTTVAPGANAHQIITNAANTIAYVPCKGADRIAVYGFDAATGSLSTRPSVTTANGAGPRHIALHPSGSFAFVINENNSTITSYTVAANGNLTEIETVSSLPADFTGQNTGAEIAVHRSGGYIYASNRGHDSIVRFAFADQKLTDPTFTKTFGMRPRHFSLALDDTVLLVANQGSGGIHAFRIAAAGELTAVGELTTATGPGFVGAITAR